MLRGWIRQSAMLAAATLAVAMFAPSTPVSATQRPSGTVPAVGNLSAIACPTTSRCVAVGSDNSLNGKGATVAVASSAATVGHGTLTSDDLNSVACATATSCVAVAPAATVRVTVASGAIVLVRALHPPSGEIDALGAVACPSPSGCYAVGFQGTEVHSKALLVHLSATGVLLGSTLSGSSGFAAIACPTTTRCLLAAANRTNPEEVQLLNGGHLGAGHLLPAKTYIQAMTCYKSLACFALAGKSGSSPRADEIISINPVTGAIGSKVVIAGTFSGNGIACANASQCIAVGFTGPSKPAIAVITHGKAGKATVIGGVGLDGVACTPTGVCLAVGQQTNTVGLVRRV